MKAKTTNHKPDKHWKTILYNIIFKADTKSGKTFDIILLILIALSVIVVLLNSVESINIKYGKILFYLEWLFTFLFTIEFFLRISCVKKIYKYIFSFFGIIDLLAVFPNYIGFFVSGITSLIVFRAFRLLRIFIIFKLGRYIGQANYLLNALKKGFRKIVVFLGTVLTIIIIMGALMYLIEGEDPESGFDSIPKSMYWAIVTLTTVGYGDISPQTILGQTISAVIMLLGYGIIAVPTGILSAEITIGYNKRNLCPECKKNTNLDNSNFCSNCGFKFKVIK